MSAFQIKLHDVEDVKKFVDIANKYPCKIDLIADQYRIDAKSIMGIFSLDLSKPITIEVDETCAAFLEEIDCYIVK